MSARRRLTPCSALAVLFAATLLSVQCGDASSPSAPSTPASMGGVTLSSSTIAVGTAVQGTVSLTGAAPAGGLSVALTSSDPAVATVATPLHVPDGSASVTFAIATTAVGVATITASLNGTSESSRLTVTAVSALGSLGLSSDAVVGGTSVTGTVRMNDAPGPGGALVALTTADPARVPPTVLVPAGALSATFEVSTRAVGGVIATIVTGTYAGLSTSAALSVLPAAVSPVAIAGFGVSGTSGSDTCVLIDAGNSLDCTFNGSSSSAPGTIVEWKWSYSVATAMMQTTTGPLLATPPADCSLLPQPPLPDGTTSFPLIVRLTVRDSLGNVSEEAVNTGARVVPNGMCGF